MRCARSAITELAILLVACGVQRESTFAPVCPGYEKQIAPLLDRRCGSCHGARADAGWRVDSYRHVLWPSEEDVARVVPGERDSLLLQAARGELTGHEAIGADDVALLETWVVRCEAAPDPTRFHPTGWGSPVSSAFHGGALRDAGYVTIACQECHGQDLRGGKARVDCNTCHAQGPFACDTCHGDETSPAPPKSLSRSRSVRTLGVGAHRTHVLDSELHLAYGCEKCHPQVTNAEDEGHYRFGDRFVADAPVVVLASFPDAGVTPSWDRTAATCTNVACHAPRPSDAAATHMTPKWTESSGSEDVCGACHGLGPQGHQSKRCEGCHAPGYADGGVELALHANGRIDLLPGTQCGICHAAPGSTEFFDTQGGRDPATVSVGAHSAHLKAGRLRGPLGCNDCHVQPPNAFAAGHVDTPLPAEVFPVTWSGGLASFDSATPAFDHAAASCSSVYCHGNGAFLVAHDQTQGLTRAPSWTGGPAQAACGACHGLPPLDGRPAHALVTSIGGCAQCHGLAVLADGGVRLVQLPDGGMTSFHIDGVVNGNY